MTIPLNYGHSIKVYDCTRPYFGDYHHVRLEIRLELSGMSGNISDFNHYDASQESEASPSYVITLERMAVPTASLAECKQSLLDYFCRVTLPYMNNPMYFERLREKTLAQKRVKSSFTPY